MILTVTPNPSIDVTMRLESPLEPGAVHRVVHMDEAAGGKGVNVAQVLSHAGEPARAVFPAAEDDVFRRLATAADVPWRAVPITGPVRRNTTVTCPDGTTTKLNGPGPELSAAEVTAVENLAAGIVAREAPEWAVLAGSLPPGLPPDWYPRLIARLRRERPGLRIALDTSEAPLRALRDAGSGGLPDLLTPNGRELGQLLDEDGAAWEDAAARGETGPLLRACRRLLREPLREILVTLGAAGAILVTPRGAWRAAPPPIRPASTVGAGDSSLAGLLLGYRGSADPGRRLRLAVAAGSAATALPGTRLPHPEDLDPDHVTVTRMG